MNMSQTGYRQRTDFAVTTGAVQDAYRALGKLERGWAHEDYDVSPSYRSHHMHAHTIDPYRPAHLRDYGSQKAAGVPWGTISPRRGRPRHRHQYGHTHGYETARRAYSLPPSRPLSYGHLVERRIEHSYQPSEYCIPTVSISQLRSRTAAARDKLDLARSMYDRYLPADSGTPEDVRSAIEGRVGAILGRYK